MLICRYCGELDRWPAAGSGRRVGTATRRPHAGASDCGSRRTPVRWTGAEPAALRTGVDGHFTDFRGVPWVHLGVGRPSGAAERPTLTPSGPLTAGRRCQTAVEGSECRHRQRDDAQAAAAAVNSWWELRSAARSSDAPSRRGRDARRCRALVAPSGPAARLGPGWHARHTACAPNLLPG